MFVAPEFWECKSIQLITGNLVYRNKSLEGFPPQPHATSSPFSLVERFESHKAGISPKHPIIQSALPGPLPKSLSEKVSVTRVG